MKWVRYLLLIEVIPIRSNTLFFSIIGLNKQPNLSDTTVAALYGMQNVTCFLSETALIFISLLYFSFRTPSLSDKLDTPLFQHTLAWISKSKAYRTDVVMPFNHTVKRQHSPGFLPGVNNTDHFQNAKSTVLFQKDNCSDCSSIPNFNNHLLHENQNLLSSIFYISISFLARIFFSHRIMHTVFLFICK